MGLSMFSSSCGSKPNPTLPNPNPKRFAIKALESVGLFTVALINYPDCTTYGGDKILVYYCQPHHIERLKEIDPHFLELGKALSPIARFPAHDKGWEHAVKFAAMLGN